MDDKATLITYLRLRRADLLGKLDGLSEYDARRPMTPTGTNLLGLVKHVASVELGYFGEVFGRPSGRDLPWLADDAEPDSDMWVPATESREEILELHHFSAKHSDETIESLPLDAPGVVPWGRGLGIRTSPAGPRKNGQPTVHALNRQLRRRATANLKLHSPRISWANLRRSLAT